MAPPGARLGVAVSGGADSVALLDILLRLGYPLHVLHVNHGLRGADSEEDERFVRVLADRCRLPVEVLRAPPPPPGGNLEQTLRRIRYSFFEDARRRLRLERIATGHTLSDQAETVLLRLARGAGVQGLCGVHPVTRHGVIRPLLACRREEIRGYLSSRGLTWREDASNADPRWRRNLVRAELLPRLRDALNPQLEAALARTAALAWDDEQDWQRRVREALETLPPNQRPRIVESRWLRALGPALGRRVVRALLAEAAGTDRRLGLDHAGAAWRLATGPEGGGRLLAPGVEVWRSLEWVRFAPPRAARSAAPPETARLDTCGQALLGPWTILVSGHPPGGCYDEVSALDPRAVSFPLTARFWRPGDRFQPAGRGGPLKLKDLFQKAGIPSWERTEWPMVESGGRIIWCRGFGAAAWARPGREEAAGLWVAAARGRQ